MTGLTVDIRELRLAGRVVLGPVAFTVAAGEVVALVGPSGCGKSTLLRLAAGLAHDGLDGAVHWTPAPRRPGVVFQQPRLLPWRTVRQNLAIAGADPALAADLLGRLGLASSADAWASHLSLGMARRLALVRALAIHPDALLLDEPFTSLDEANAVVARTLLLERWHHRPVPTLLVTHDLAEAASLADRVLVLSPGPARLLADHRLPPDAVRRPDAVTGTVAALRGMMAV
ncbi:MAG: ATP-binding cassette domain-containing protein [Azospirillaceae bacterium]|nr:ATP-binding cassette domain-containing protein [Azospirillaceae bacterium]